jgi:hypothetical protein
VIIVCVPWEVSLTVVIVIDVRFMESGNVRMRSEREEAGSFKESIVLRVSKGVQRQ